VITDTDIVEILEAYEFDLSSEGDLQDGISQVLDREGIDYDREVRLSPQDRIDFLIDDVGIEVKINGSITSVVKQLQRYAKSDRITSLILVTGRTQLSRIPDRLNGKPLRVAALLSSIL
jgi:hypothetical protein